MLKDKRILVVGAGGLLGSKLVVELINAGASPVAVDIDIDRVKSRLSSMLDESCIEGMSLLSADICNESSVKSIFLQAGELDGLVNCSYPRGPEYGKPFFDVSLSGFNENVSMHLGSAFLLMREAASRFTEQQRPFSFVNLSSVYGVVAPKFEVYKGTTMTMPVEYAAIKSGILQLSKYVTSYVKDSRFRVNSVSPGGIEDKQPEAFQQAYRAHTLGKGMLDVEDVLGAIMFLLSDLARYVNGQNIIVDDGFAL